MMTQITHRNVAVAAAMVFGAVLVALPGRPAAAEPVRLAQASPPASTAPAQPGASRKAVDRVEAHIKQLHDQLKITPAQEPSWQTVAQVMRENAKRVSELSEQREKQEATATAIDDLKSYAAIADAHAEGVRKLIPPFEALYDSMSDAQKRIADEVFRHRPRRSASKKSG
ncbi:MAG: hypothetical protein JWL84_19 [Rhodospirillales bacterium]|jgi:protein CpxP|nr:hypothetical protein [Rhodospirillales bacterium]